jgi:hypothetical protein
LTLSPHPPHTHRADLDALDCVLGVLDAARCCDEDAIRPHLRDDVTVRTDGVLEAIGADAAAAVEAERWLHLDDDGIQILDVHVASPLVYVRFAVHAPAREGGGRQATMVGYSIYEVDGQHLVSMSHFHRTLAARPAPESLEPEVTERVAPPEPLAQPQPLRRRGWALALAGIGSWLVQDLLLATPVVAFANHYGSWRSFALFAPAYAALALVLSLLTVHLLQSPDPAPENRFARWLASGEHHPRTVQLVRAGGAFGFVASSYLFSGPPTVWALHQLGFRRRMRLYALCSSLISGTTFVASYLLVAELVLF